MKCKLYSEKDGKKICRRFGDDKHECVFESYNEDECLDRYVPNMVDYSAKGFKKKVSKPYPDSIAAGGYEILYKCRECGYSFRLADDGFNYCPHCGVKLDWGVVVTANKEWQDEFIDAVCDYKDKDKGEKRDKLLANLDALNQTITNGKKHEMRKTQATKDDITYRNICYYLGNGWTREELLREGKYTEEDFKVYDREKWKE